MRLTAIDDFMRYQFLSALAFSPDGKRAAFVVSKCAEDQQSYRSEIWLYDVQAGAMRPLTAMGKEKGFIWEDSDTLLFPASRSEADKKAAEAGPYTAFYRIHADGGEARFAFSVPLRGASAQKTETGYLLRATYDPSDALEKVPGKPTASVQVLDEIPFWFNGKGFVGKRRSRLYHYIPGEDVSTVLTPELGDVGALALSPDGKQAAYALTVFDSVNPQRAAVCVTTLATGETRQVLPPGEYGISRIAFLGDSLILCMSDEKQYGTSENDKLFRLSLADGSLSVIAAPDTDICGNAASDCRYGSGNAFKVDRDRLYLTLCTDHNTTLYAMDASGGMTALSDGKDAIDCFDVVNGNILCVAMRGQRLQELYRISGGQFDLLSHFNDEILADCYVATPAPLSFTNEDGVRIDGWVLTPPDFNPAAKYPAIFAIHGGPKAVYGELFYHEMQYWASHGYIVFFCNPRGSGARGNEFADLRGKYGTIDYSDLMAFADKVLAAYPAIDQSRVCVAGGSYGGFMVNWMIGHTDRFAAACSQRSIANWTSKCLTTDIGYYHNLSQIAGDPWNTPELFWEKSPLKHVPHAKTPTLFIHSDEDYRCWMSEGLQMFTALKMHGVPTRLCLFAGENHELSRSGKPVNRIRRLQEITDWFDQYTHHTAPAGNEA